MPKFFAYRQTDAIEDLPGFNDAVWRMEDAIHEQVKEEIEKEKQEITKLGTAIPSFLIKLII